MVNSQDLKDPQRFEIFNRHRGLLFSIAYRMLGSAADAEDMVQESYIRWRQAAEMEIRSPRAFLVTVVSRLCINHLQSARVQREEYLGQWLPEPLVTGPLDGGPSEIACIDQSLSMAFLVLLEKLNPTERAVFLLREVFDYEYAEISPMLGLNEANCRQILRRARQHIADKRPRFEASQQQHESLLHEFVRPLLAATWMDSSPFSRRTWFSILTAEERRPRCPTLFMVRSMSGAPSSVGFKDLCLRDSSDGLRKSTANLASSAISTGVPTPF